MQLLFYSRAKKSFTYLCPKNPAAFCESSCVPSLVHALQEKSANLRENSKKPRYDNNVAGKLNESEIWHRLHVYKPSLPLRTFTSARINNKIHLEKFYYRSFYAFNSLSVFAGQEAKNNLKY